MSFKGSAKHVLASYLVVKSKFYLNIHFVHYVILPPELSFSIRKLILPTPLLAIATVCILKEKTRYFIAFKKKMPLHILSIIPTWICSGKTTGGGGV
jgi:hypothetical protein